MSYTNAGVDSFTLGSDPDSALAFQWSQEVPHHGKRRLAGDVARAEIDVVAQTLEATRLRVRAEVEIAYAELYRLGRTETILSSSRDLLGSIRDTTRARYEGGQGILENVLRTQTELAKIEAQIATIGQERRAVELRLGALLGRAWDSSFDPPRAPLAVPDLDLATLQAAASDRSPELRTLRAIVAREQKRVDLARKSLGPDFAWTAGYANRGGLDPMVMGGFGIRLPIHRQQKQEQAIAQSDLECQAAERDLESRQVLVLAEVRDLVAQVDRARTLVRLYEEGVLPQAWSAFDAASSSFAVGRVEFLTLIEDFRAVLGYEIEAEDQRTDGIRSAAALERLTATPLVRAGDGAAAGSGGPHE